MKELLQKCIDELNKKFALKEIGQLHHFLGVEVCWHHLGNHFTQTIYITELLKIFELQNLNPCPTSIIASKTM